MAAPRLSAGAGIAGLIPYSHHPVYTAGLSHENDEEMREALEPFFDAADVRLVLAGHEHNFQVSEVGGRTYVVSGAAGQLDEEVPEASPTPTQQPGGSGPSPAHRGRRCRGNADPDLVLDDGRLHAMTAPHALQ